MLTTSAQDIYEQALSEFYIYHTGSTSNLVAMRYLSVMFTLITFTMACPMHEPPDPVVVEQNIAAANIRKRGYVRPAPQKVAITNVHVFDGFEYDNETSTVVIDGSFIGDDATDALVINGNGGTLMPGLIDSHNHPLAIEDLQNLSSYGVTTTMCMSCWAASDLCASLRNQPGLTGKCSQLMTMRSTFVVDALQANHLIDLYSAGYSAVVPNSSHSKLAETLPQINAPQYFIYNASMGSSWVKGRIDTGSDWIKLVAESSGPTMSQEEHNVIVESAHQYGYWTATHASTLDAYETAIDSGTDFIQHTPADALLSNSTIAKILAKKQHVTPTMNIYQHVNATQRALNLTAEEAAKLNQTVMTNVKNMYDAGVPILAGTDGSTNLNGPAQIPFGSSLHQELTMLRQTGVSGLDVLKAATSRAARAYNMLDRGVIAPGRRADLLLVRGNPLADISNLDQIEKVWIAGLEYSSSLS